MEARDLKKMVSFDAMEGQPNWKRPSQRRSFFPGKRTDRVTPVFRDLCASNYPSLLAIETLWIALHCWFLQLMKTSFLYATGINYYPVFWNFSYERFENTRIRYSICVSWALSQIKWEKCDEHENTINYQMYCVSLIIGAPVTTCL